MKGVISRGGRGPSARAVPCSCKYSVCPCERESAPGAFVGERIVVRRCIVIHTMCVCVCAALSLILRKPLMCALKIAISAQEQNT